MEQQRSFVVISSNLTHDFREQLGNTFLHVVEKGVLVSQETEGVVSLS